VQTILVVDDTLDNRAIIGQMLRLSGYRVLLAASGEEAIKLAEQELPDLILMDLAMPGMDGWSATEQIRSRVDLAHLPVIAVTGHVMRDEIERAIRAGCQDYLAKPIDYETMLAKVRTFLTV
jgi:two-component system cell cycle response regulator DivK